MRVLHADDDRGWRGGQVQLGHLLGPDDGLLAPDDGRLARSATVPRWTYGIHGLVSAIREFRPDVIAAHTSRAHGLCVLQPFAPVVVHRRVDFRPRSRWGKYRLPLGYVAVSAAVRAVLVDVGVRWDRVRVVPDGIEAPASMAPVDRPPGLLAVAVGALVPHKGHEVLVRAAAEGRFTVWIAGDGPLRARLESLATELGADVRLLGWRDDVPALLAAADVFVHPSLEEGLGQVVLEARALGCRTVVSRAGGVCEAVGPHALSVPPGDVDALARAVRAAAGMVRPAAELPECFTVAAMQRGTREAYARLLSDG